MKKKLLFKYKKYTTSSFICKKIYSSNARSAGPNHVYLKKYLNQIEEISVDTIYVINRLFKY